jgi:hypothetical protein
LILPWIFYSASFSHYKWKKENEQKEVKPCMVSYGFQNDVKITCKRLSVIVLLVILLLGFGSSTAYADENVTAEVIGSGTVLVTWKPYHPWEIQYYIEVWGDGLEQNISVVGTGTISYEITGLTNGRSYAFKVLYYQLSFKIDWGISDQVIPTAFASSFAVEVPAVSAGETFPVTIRALNASGETETGYAGPHAINWDWNASASPYGMMPEKPASASIIFTEGSATIGGFKLFNAAETPVITVTDDKGATGISGPITVQPLEPVIAIDFPAVAIKSQANDLIVKILDIYGNITNPAYITLNSTDLQCILPTGIQFYSSDNNVKVIPNVVFNTTGLQTIRATCGTRTGAKTFRVGLQNRIAAGGRHSLALKADGTVAAWGNNSFGQRDVSGLTNVVSVAAGSHHSLYLKADGTVVARGMNDEGQSTVPAGLDNVVQIAAGRFHSLALKRDGTVVGWGCDDLLPGDLKDVVDIACNTDHSLALKADGTVVSWGENGYGQDSVPPELSDVIAIAAGYYHSLALKSDGTVVAWGGNGFGQASVPTELNNVIAIAAGYNYSLALKADGRVVGWGNNNRGQFSDLPDNVAAISSWSEHTLALMKDGTVVAKGYNAYGQTEVPSGLNLSGKLSSLTVDHGTLEPAFAPDTLAYNLTVADTLNILSISAVISPDNPHALLNINGQPTESGEDREVTLNEGANTIPVTVTTPNDGLTRTYTLNVTRTNPAYSAEAQAATLTPAAGSENTITLTVKGMAGNISASFTGTKSVTISGYSKAPNGTYGSFNGTTLNSSSQAIDVTFNNGVANPVLVLNNAEAQDIMFTIAGVEDPATSILTITPVHAATASMDLTQDITAPAAGGNLFASQPKITFKDSYGNICTNNNTVQVTAAKKDQGAWSLTGAKTAKASNGVAAFTDLGFINTFAVSGAKLEFTAADLAPIESSPVDLPASTAPCSLVITGPSDPSAVKEGVPFGVTVEVKDFGGRRATGCKETISFKSSDPEAVLPGNYTFTEQDAGIKSFSITFNTPGEQSLTIAELGAGGLLGYWNFDEGSGTTAHDASGHNNHGTLVNGPTWRSDDLPEEIKFANPHALLMDGYNDIVELPAEPRLDNKSFSISFWAKVTKPGPMNIVVGSSDLEAGANKALHVGYRDDDTFTFAFWSNDLNVNAPNDKEWHHWVVTYDIITGKRFIYRDGTKIGEDTANSPFLGTSSLRIGRAPDGAATKLGGSVDDVRNWGAALMMCVFMIGCWRRKRRDTWPEEIRGCSLVLSASITKKYTWSPMMPTAVLAVPCPPIPTPTCRVTW